MLKDESAWEDVGGRATAGSTWTVYTVGQSEAIQNTFFYSTAKCNVNHRVSNDCVTFYLDNRNRWSPIMVTRTFNNFCYKKIQVYEENDELWYLN